MDKRKLFIFPTIMVFLILAAAPATASQQQTSRVNMATEVVKEIMKIPETGIPPALLADAQGIAVIPRVIKAGLVVGGEYGKGVISVRDSDGTWSAPVFVTMAGGSVGYQIGAEATDFVIVFKNRKGIDEISKGKYTRGAGASVAAGPVGRNARAATDVKLDAEIYSYSRSRGLFAGISLEGASLQVDHESDAEFYGRKTISPADILAGKGITLPDAAVGFTKTLDRYASVSNK
jgi:lipid-binding SYLF domain-containing protein